MLVYAKLGAYIVPAFLRGLNRQRRLIVALILAASVLSGCTFQRTGSVHPESGGAGIALALQWLPDGALIRGHESVSGENFKGQYYDLGGPAPIWFRTELPVTTEQLSFAYGSVLGDQGTAIDCHIVVGEGLPLPPAVLEGDGPHGLGLCRNGRGEPYRLLF